MNPKLKAKWIRALRSGRYEQTESQLVNRDGDGFCCLGVLADIQGCVWEEDNTGSLHPIMPHGRETFGVNSAGIKSCSYLKPRKAGGLSLRHQRTLAGLNDSGKSFPEIADYIKENL